MNRLRDICVVPECTSSPVAEGYCFGHYSKVVAKGLGTCSVTGCGNKARHARLCAKHARTGKS